MFEQGGHRCISLGLDLGHCFTVIPLHRNDDFDIRGDSGKPIFNIKFNPNDDAAVTVVRSALKAEMASHGLGLSNVDCHEISSSLVVSALPAEAESGAGDNPASGEGAT